MFLFTALAPKIMRVCAALTYVMVSMRRGWQGWGRGCSESGGGEEERRVMSSCCCTAALLYTRSCTFTRWAHTQVHASVLRETLRGKREKMKCPLSSLQSGLALLCRMWRPIGRSLSPLSFSVNENRYFRGFFFRPRPLSCEPAEPPLLRLLIAAEFTNPCLRQSGRSLSGACFD